MIFRIFIALVLIVAGYFTFEIVRGFVLQNAVTNVDEPYILGNPDGNLTLVEFMDYNCVHCKDAHPVIMEAVERDGNVRFAPRPVDMLEPAPTVQARIAYAAGKQGAFAAMHQAMIDNNRIVDEQVMQDLALEIGIDPTQLREDYESDEVKELAQENMNLFLKLRMGGTPTYAVGRKIMFTPYERSPTVEDFLAIFEEARSLQ